MSKADRLAKREQEVSGMMALFEKRLREKLQACASGRWVLFGQNDAVSGNLLAGTDSGRKLLTLAGDIDDARRELGYSEPFTLAERFRAYRGRE
ncbi:MAG: hypothetical protein KGN02_07070 [bacterium]|nr:hypothetical protein [bacterium]